MKQCPVIPHVSREDHEGNLPGFAFPGWYGCGSALKAETLSLSNRRQQRVGQTVQVFVALGVDHRILLMLKLAQKIDQGCGIRVAKKLNGQGAHPICRNATAGFFFHVGRQMGAGVAEHRVPGELGIRGGNTPPLLFDIMGIIYRDAPRFKEGGAEKHGIDGLPRLPDQSISEGLFNQFRIPARE